MKDIRGLKGTFEGYMWMLDSTGTASQDKIQEFDMAKVKLSNVLKRTHQKN